VFVEVLVTQRHRVIEGHVTELISWRAPIESEDGLRPKVVDHPDRPGQVVVRIRPGVLGPQLSHALWSSAMSGR
jgi:hypothetical protein